MFCLMETYTLKLFFQMIALPCGSNGRVHLQHRRLGFNSWVGKIPWREGMAIHSSILAWRIPWTEKPSGLQLMGLHRVRHDWGTNTRIPAQENFISQFAKYFMWILGSVSSGQETKTCPLFMKYCYFILNYKWMKSFSNTSWGRRLGFQEFSFSNLQWEIWQVTK